MTPTAGEPVRRGRFSAARSFWTFALAIGLLGTATAQEPPDAADTPESGAPSESQVVVYAPEFFERYDPVTALDMVRQVPGFKLEQTGSSSGGGDVRGFGAAAVNVLINGKRPSTKSDSMESLLGRIAAAEVVRLELIRGATGAGDRDITQSSVVVNVVLDEAATGRDPAPWEAAFHYEDGALSLLGELAVSLKAGRTSYRLGFERAAYDWNLEGPERFTSPTRPPEARREIFFREGYEHSLDLKTATELSGGGRLRLNLLASDRSNDESETSDRRVEGAGPELFLRSGKTKTRRLEIGGDLERDLSPRLAMKLVALLRRAREDSESGLDIQRPAASRASRSPRSSDSGESIGRFELDWSGWSRHTLKFGLELVHNFVDSTSDLFVDDGGGPVAVVVPGSDTRVVERRAEAFVTDSWQSGEKVTVDWGFGLEISEISQSGDVGNSRSFQYPKPSVSIAYSPSTVSQWRFRLERQVSQLDFFDFVSASNFEDLDLDFGNPDLRPERTWHFEATHERRFGDLGVAGIELFHDWISDVEDLLPVGEGSEIVGNIGPARRWGGGLDLTVPLRGLGLGDSRADVAYRWQESSVTDPVTGFSRELSGESDQELELSARKELPRRRAAVGLAYNWSSPRSSYGFDEVVVETRRSHLNVHIEARLWQKTKLRFEVFNLVDDPRWRKRTVFAGTRLSEVIDFEENRQRVDDQWFRLTLSGLF